MQELNILRTMRFVDVLSPRLPKTEKKLCAVSRFHYAGPAVRFYFDFSTARQIGRHRIGI